MTTKDIPMRPAAVAAFGAALAAGLLALAASPGHAQQARTGAGNTAIYCQGYAQDAVRTYRRYVAKQCGQRFNNVWNPHYGVHYDYCMRTTPTNAAWLQNQRYRLISQECGDGFDKPGARPQPRRG
jgi:hypothetical protein